MMRKTSSKKTTNKSHTIKLKKDDYEITITETPTKKTTSRRKAAKNSVKRKSVKKKSVKKASKKKPTEVHYHSTKEIKVEKALIENFIGLQKVMVNLSSRFDELSTQISRLLNLFEVSAKAMAKKEFERSQDPDLKKVLDRLDNLSRQAGLIGHGLALIHEVNEEKHERTALSQTHFEPQHSSVNPQLRNPNFKPSPRPQSQSQGSMEMQPSIMKPSSAPVSVHTPKRAQKTSQAQTKEVDENEIHEENV